MFNYSITDYMTPHDLHETPDSISKNLNISRVVIYLFQFSDSLSTNI